MPLRQLCQSQLTNLFPYLALLGSLHTWPDEVAPACHIRLLLDARRREHLDASVYPVDLLMPDVGVAAATSHSRSARAQVVTMEIACSEHLDVAVRESPTTVHASHPRVHHHPPPPSRTGAAASDGWLPHAAPPAGRAVVAGPRLPTMSLPHPSQPPLPPFLLVRHCAAPAAHAISALPPRVRRAHAPFSGPHARAARAPLCRRAPPPHLCQDPAAPPPVLGTTRPPPRCAHQRAHTPSLVRRSPRPPLSERPCPSGLGRRPASLRTPPAFPLPHPHCFRRRAGTTDVAAVDDPDARPRSGNMESCMLMMWGVCWAAIGGGD
jgi:hypothetical protein